MYHKDFGNIPDWKGNKAVILEVDPKANTIYIRYENGEHLVFDSNAYAMDPNGKEWFWSGRNNEIIPAN